MNLLQTILNDVQTAGHRITGQPVDPSHNAGNPTKIPYDNGFYAGAHHDTPTNNTTKIPYNNGFYAGAYQPNRVDPSNLHPQLLKQLLNVVAPHLAADPGMTDVLRQGGEQNPGFIPLQNSGVGRGTNPQQGAFQDQYGQLSAPAYGQADPQAGNGYYYN